ncbi:methyltransferase, FxLD system [Streptomyces sp. NPDC048106]|uniref:methyltransferase, FxLD system n=1 Tax=Streptomyces sp. NPDC048106 TaxID=3155750 RepID=UPI003451A77E
MTYTVRDQWQKHYSDGKNFRRLGERERELLAEHAPVPEAGGRALDVSCGTGELAAYLAGLGYRVDACEFADSAIARAREEHTNIEGVRWLHLDIERDGPAPLDDTLYDLVVFRLSVAFLHDRMRVLHALGRRLREGGTVLVITPLAAHTSAEKRHIALNEDEISALTCGWTSVQRIAVGDLAALVLRGPCAGTVATERSVPATGYAVAGALAIVTNEHGRVLLGWSRRGMWEIPGGKVEGAEPLDEAGVRELAEETGLHATGASVVTILTDAAQGVPRLTAVIRIAGVTGTLITAEPEKFTRWEWHDPHGLGCLGPVFTPSAQALNAVWPGVIPGLPPVHSYPVAANRPPVPGEPAEAVRRRQAMAQTVIGRGWASSEPVRSALRTVPRHRFAPEANLAVAYDGGDRAVITRRDETGTAISSVSAAWLQADMIEHLHLKPGAIVFEAGSGGYNAELIAHVAGPEGRVVTVDIDPWVVCRTRAFLTEAGSGRVTAVEADAALGAPAHLVPRSGFDASVITYNCWDISPAWREQLAEGGRLVLPLEMGGYTRAITFERHGEVLHARHFTYCGFVRDQGQQAHAVPVVPLFDGALTLRFDDGAAADTKGLEEALRGRRHEVTTGVTMGANSYFGSLQLYAATTLPAFCRLHAHQDTGLTAITKDRDAPAVLGTASLAYLTYVQTRHGECPEDKEWEWVVHAFGEEGPQLAEQLAATVRAWDRHVRADDNDQHADPVLTVHPADTPDHLLPAGDVLDKASSRLVFRWPGRDGHIPAPARRTDTVAATTGEA